ncbi:MAG TPA: hypothetical protein VGB64_15050 [Actinomycetota bacterium]
MGSPLYADPDGPLRLAVIADSTAFTGPAGPLLPDDPALYPNVAARAIEDAIGRRVIVGVVAHPGTGVRGTHYDVTKNRHIMFEVLMRADGVVLGLGSFDHAPVGVPPPLEAMIPFVRPAALRRRYRALLRAVHPAGVRLTRGRFARVPAGEFERLFDRILHEVRALTWGAPGVVVGPTSHRSGYYGHLHPQHTARTAMQRTIAARHGFPFVESWPLVEPWVEKLNADGIHWPFETHEEIGRAVAAALVPQIRGEIAPPGIPHYEGFDEAFARAAQRDYRREP